MSQDSQSNINELKERIECDFYTIKKLQSKIKELETEIQEWNLTNDDLKQTIEARNLKLDSQKAVIEKIKQKINSDIHLVDFEEYGLTENHYIDERIKREFGKILTESENKQDPALTSKFEARKKLVGKQ